MANPRPVRSWSKEQAKEMALRSAAARKARREQYQNPTQIDSQPVQAPEPIQASPALIEEESAILPGNPPLLAEQTQAETPSIPDPSPATEDHIVWQGVRVRPVPDPEPPKPLKYVYSTVVPVLPKPDPARDRVWRRHGAGPVQCVGGQEQAAPVQGPRKIIQPLVGKPSRKKPK